MRHRRQMHKLGRNWSERKALLECLVTSLLNHQEITTTLEKAQAAKRLADRVISLGKKDTLSSRRQVFSYLQNHDLTSKVFKEVAPRFKNRQGGYTRVMKLHRRKGDGAQLVILELTEKEILVKEEKKPKGKAASARLEKPEATHPSAEPEITKETHFPKHSESKKEKPKTGFLKNLSRFFRNKGGG